MREDREQALDLCSKLEDLDLSVFMYNPGEPFDDPVQRVTDAIFSATLLILVGDREQNTDWVRAEIEYAEQLKKEFIAISNAGKLPRNIKQLARSRGLLYRDKTDGTIPVRFSEALHSVFWKRLSEGQRGIAKLDYESSCASREASNELTREEGEMHDRGFEEAWGNIMFPIPPANPDDPTQRYWASVVLLYITLFFVLLRWFVV